MKPVVITLVNHVYYDAYINEIVLSFLQPELILKWAGDYPIIYLGVL